MKQSESEYLQLGASKLYNDQKICILKTSNFPVLFRTNKNWLKTLNRFISQETWLSTSTFRVLLVSLFGEQ